MASIDEARRLIGELIVPPDASVARRRERSAGFTAVTEIPADVKIHFETRRAVCGVAVRLKVCGPMAHVWHTFDEILPEESRTIDRIVTFVDSQWRGDDPQAVPAQSKRISSRSRRQTH
ncbi:MAG: hypothetical protein ABI376_02410 [Caulobacteraceae bacterium]